MNVPSKRGLRRHLVSGLLILAALGPIGVANVHAQSLGPQVSITIVEPKDQTRWGYAPGTRKVTPGTWVTWSNNGQDEHTVTAVDGSFDSQTLEPSDGFSWYFDQPGQYQYICTLHPWMKGTIVVTGDPAPPPPPPDDGSSDTGGD
jgi:plastocyanin